MAPKLRKLLPPVLFVLVTAALAGRLGFIFFKAEDKRPLLPGKTTAGHYQIELECAACHTAEKNANVFTSAGVPNSACTSCHGEDLAAAADSHPVRKFLNPENAVFLNHIDATSCIACHREHAEEITGPMGLTLPADYCAHCHEVTLENVKSHQGLGYDTCATAGCHNYHDNVALTPSFLLKHYGEADILPNPGRPLPDTLARWLDEGNDPRPPLEPAAADAPPARLDAAVVENWHHTAHAAAGINCSDCHDGVGAKSWVEKPTHLACAACHDFEVTTFLKGKHGMRLAHEDLGPMQPALARQPMKADAAHRTLDCNACHQSHEEDTRFAAYQACVQCHDDNHTRAYESSAHHRLWQAELTGSAPAGSGVSCATCHMPALEIDGHFAVSHDQSANLRPNEKMLNSVCANCHGLQFSMDALANPELITGNFHQRPGQRHPGIDWTVEAAVDRGDKKIIDLRRWLQANPGHTRGDASPSE